MISPIHTTDECEPAIAAPATTLSSTLQSHPPILQAGLVLARGRIRRVWRRRYLELTADGILKYYEAQEEDGGTTTSGTAIPTAQGRPEESEKEGWEDVAESCYEKNSASAGNMTTSTKSNVKGVASVVSIGEVERIHHLHQPKPRAILLILRARLLNPSLPKDAKSGLPPNKFGFLFHGHILYYDNSTMAAEPDTSTSTANNNISGSCTSTTSTSGVGNILSLYSSRPFHCAVSRQIDAIRWVRALQSVAVSNSMGFATILPPRYAPLKELECEDFRHMTEASSAGTPIIMEGRSYEVSFSGTWEESLFDPLNIISPLMVQASGKNIAEGTNPAATSCCDDLRLNEGTEEGKEEPLQHPSPERGSSSFAKMNPLMRLCATLKKFKARTWDTKLHRQPKDQQLWSSPYLCALGVAFWCGALLQKRLSKATPSLFVNTRHESVANVRADAAALGIAFAFIFGYRIGMHSVISDKTRQATHFTPPSEPSQAVKVVEKISNDRTEAEVHEVCETHYRERDDASHEEEEPMLLSPLHPYNGTINSWSEPQASLFKVRGTSYFVDRVKIPSGPAAFPCRGVEIWLADNPLRHIARHPSMLGGKLGEVDTFLVNFLLPFGNFVSYFTMTADCDLPVHVQEAWTKFRKGDQQYRDARLKLLPLVIEGPWIVKTVVGNGSAPALLGKVVPLQYFFTEPSPTCKSVFEVDVIISASNIAKGILNVVKGNTKHLTLAFAIIIEAAETSELPECVLCAFQVHSLHLDLCPRLTECDPDCM